MLNPLDEYGSHRYLKNAAIKRLTVPLLSAIFESALKMLVRTLIAHYGPMSQLLQLGEIIPTSTRM
jgi:hypothetical protein